MLAPKKDRIDHAAEDITRCTELMQSIELGSRDSTKNNKTQQAREQTKYHFRHKPLDTYQQSIRLVRISPQADGDLEFELQHFAFKQRPQYRAVSYMWGRGLLWTIKINDQPFQVKENLYNLLKTMSAAADSGYLWIDQICIDQTDIFERNQQVSFMSDIYGAAQEVVIWLGVCGQEHEETAAFINHFVAHELGSRSETATCRYRSAQVLSQSLRCFLNNQYWTRLWIVQEILKARALIVKWGTFEIRWPALCSMLLGYRHCDAVGSTSIQLRTLAKCALYRTGVNRGVFKFMSAFCGSQCQDQRDKVYGLLAITHLKLQIVDYARSPEEVFLDAVYAMEQETSNIGFGEFVQLVRMLAVEMLTRPDSKVEDQYSVGALRKNSCEITQLPNSSQQLSIKDARGMTLLHFVVILTGYTALEVMTDHPASTRLVKRIFHELMLTKPIMPLILTKELRFVPSAWLADHLYSPGFDGYTR